MNKPPQSLPRTGDWARLRLRRPRPPAFRRRHRPPPVRAVNEPFPLQAHQTAIDVALRNAGRRRPILLRSVRVGDHRPQQLRIVGARAVRARRPPAFLRAIGQRKGRSGIPSDLSLLGVGSRLGSGGRRQSARLGSLLSPWDKQRHDHPASLCVQHLGATDVSESKATGAKLGPRTSSCQWSLQRSPRRQSVRLPSTSLTIAPAP